MARQPVLVLAAVLALSGAAEAQTSRLWGAHGELWSPASRLPDFSHAGYHGGETLPPSPAVVADVRDFGAVGDGQTDDTAAFQAAIDAAQDGAVWVPAGRYRISNVLTVSKSHVVLRGAGPDNGGSVLSIDKSLTDVLGPDEAWSYSGGFLRIEGPGPGGTLAHVTQPELRGSKSLTVDTTQGLAPGQLVELVLTDDQERSLGWHLHAGLLGPGDCSYQVPLLFEWPVRVATLVNGTLTLAQPLRTDVRPSWSPVVRGLSAIEEVGIEDLRIEFPDVPYAGHLKEPGYNAIFMTNGVANAWVRNVTVVNADSAFLTEQHVKNVSFDGLRLEGRDGHHGFNFNQSSDVLVRDVFIANSFRHSITVDHRSNGVVVSRAGGNLPLSLDHHRDSPFENLFTEVSDYDFLSGGSACAGPNAGARNTYWNLAAPMQPPLYWAVGIQSNVVGDLAVPEKLTPDREWLEQLAAVNPPNLHEAQLAARLCDAPSNPCSRSHYDVATAACGEEPRPDGATCNGAGVCSQGACLDATLADAGEESTSSCGCRTPPSPDGRPLPFLLAAIVLAVTRWRGASARATPADCARGSRRRGTPAPRARPRRQGPR